MQSVLSEHSSSKICKDEGGGAEGEKDLLGVFLACVTDTPSSPGS